MDYVCSFMINGFSVLLMNLQVDLSQISYKLKVRDCGEMVSDSVMLKC